MERPPSDRAPYPHPPEDSLLSDLRRLGLRPTSMRRTPTVPARFTTVRELGRGGQALVYEAVDRSTGQRVALKIGLRPERTDEQRRLHREIRALRQLDHPNVARFLDSGEAGGERWYAMEFVDGRDLDAWKRESTRAIEEMVALIVPVCEGVAAAHARGIVHRDLKPSNVMVAYQGGPVVLDFGLAKQVVEATSSSLITTQGVVVGSPLWLAPEQLSGVDAIGPATDVYALGHLLYYLLSGAHPRPGNPGSYRWLQGLLDQESVPLRQQPATRGIDRDLERIVARACRRDVDQRPADAGELADELRMWLGERRRRTPRGWLGWLRDRGRSKPERPDPE